MFCTFILICFTFCKKNDTNNVIIKLTKTELLCGHSWILTAETANPPIPLQGSGLTISDLYSLLSPCEKDDFMTFYTNGNLVFDNGKLKCDSTWSQTDTIRWYFNASETEIIRNYKAINYTDTLNIESLNETMLILSSFVNFTDPNGQEYFTSKVTNTYQPK